MHEYIWDHVLVSSKITPGWRSDIKVRVLRFQFIKESRQAKCYHQYSPHYSHIDQSTPRNKKDKEIMDGLTGEWGEFVFKLIEPNDYEKITEHLKENFYKDEPLCQLMGYSDETSASFNRAVLENLTHNLSFCAFHKESQKIAGVRVMYESTQDEYSSSPACFKSKKALWTADNIVHEFLTELEDKCNIFQMYGISRCVQFKLTSVSREFRGHGLATEMYERSFGFLRAKGFTMAKGSFSSQQTRQIANKCGFKELARLYMKDFRSQDGVQLFPNSDADQYVALMALKF